MPDFRNYEINTSRTNGRVPLVERLITAHMKGEDIALSEEDENVMKRWKVVHMLSMQHRPCVSNWEIRRVLMKDFGISQITALKDITNAQKLFGNVNVANKDFKRAIYVEWLEQLASLAESKGDIKSSVAALKLASEITKLHEKDDEAGLNKSRTFNLNLFFGGSDQMQKKTFDLEKMEDLPPTEFKEILKAVDRPRIDLELMESMLEKHNGTAES